MNTLFDLAPYTVKRRKRVKPPTEPLFRLPFKQEQLLRVVWYTLGVSYIDACLEWEGTTFPDWYELYTIGFITPSGYYHEMEVTDAGEKYLIERDLL